MLKPAQSLGNCTGKQLNSAPSSPGHWFAQTQSDRSQPCWCWEWDGESRHAEGCTAAAQVHVFSPGKQSRPRWCCCPCWESPTCCSLSTQGRMRSPGLSSYTSIPFWSPSRYGPQHYLPSQSPHQGMWRSSSWLMPCPASAPSQNQTSPNPGLLQSS